ncbi:MAG TPA: cobyrinic acid a,c-diamide synthase [Mycobacteriales bacterium]
MSRRPSLPGAAELFRSTGGSGEASPSAPPAAPAERPAPAERRVSRLGPRDEGASVTSLAPAPAPVEPPVEFAAPQELDDEPEPRRTPARVRQTRRQPLRGTVDRRPSGREKHDEKITVYCSAEELFELERARLALRGDHGLVVDRGRIVREAVAVVLADLDSKGDSSILVRRLREF